jgi:hypothetical protein
MRIVVTQLGLIRGTFRDKLLLDPVLAAEVEGLFGKLEPNSADEFRLTKSIASSIPTTVKPREIYID